MIVDEMNNNCGAKVSFSQQFGDIIAEWPTHRDTIHVGVVYIPYHMVDEAERHGWLAYREGRSDEECALGLIKVERFRAGMLGTLA